MPQRDLNFSFMGFVPLEVGYIIELDPGKLLHAVFRRPRKGFSLMGNHLQQNFVARKAGHMVTRLL